MKLQQMRGFLLALVAGTSLIAKKDKDSVLDDINQRASYIAKTVTQIKDDIQCQTTIKKPKLTVVLISEQTSYNQLNYLKPFLTGGLGLLLNNGINYTNASYAHACVDTTPGHAALTTGALGQTHGMIDNNFFINGIEIFPSNDYTALSPNSLVYVANTSNGNPPGQAYPLSHVQMLGYGQSGRNLQADTLADQLVYYSTPQSTNKFFWVTNVGVGADISSFPAGQLGVPFYFDEIAGGYTSSQAYYPSAVVTITDPTGVGALATAFVVDGVITEILIENGGINYTNPIITITNPTYSPTGEPVPPTVVASTSVTVSGGVITAINLVAPNFGGSGYVGGLPDWVVNWNNAQNYPAFTSWTNTLQYPADSPAYNLPNINNYSEATQSTFINNPQTISQTGLQPLQNTLGMGATAIATLQETASFTGSISGGVLTVSGITGTLAVGDVILGAGVAPGTIILAFMSGIGGNGTYSVANTITAASTSMTSSNGTIGSLTLTNGGSGYTRGAVVAITGIELIAGTNSTLGVNSNVPASITGRGVPAVAKATVTGGVVTGLTLVSGGSGYTNPVVSIASGMASHHASFPFYLYSAAAYDSLDRYFDFLVTLLENELPSTDNMVLYLNPFVTHGTVADFGRQALDTVDSYYHLDQAFGNFITQISNFVDPSEILLSWVSDEGSNGITAYWNQAGYKNAIQDDFVQMIGAMNAAVLTATGVANIVSYMNLTDVWMGPNFFIQPAATQALILEIAQNVLASFPTVRSVYQTNQLPSTPFLPEEEDRFLKLETFPGRSGQLKYFTYPMQTQNGVPMSQSTGETVTLWDPSSHSPLILYQPGQFENKVIASPVYVNQLPITLAQILEVPRPSGAPRVWGPLPGIYCNSSN